MDVKIVKTKSYVNCCETVTMYFTKIIHIPNTVSKN